MSDPIRRALISVHDKAGLADLGRFLTGRGVELLSTGGSAATLREAGVAVTDVAEFTGFPEILDGRVKTLQPKIHGGLLAIRSNPDHVRAMLAHGIAPIDLLVVNLYPFEATVAKGADVATCIENIDIGGPALIRAGAKNHGDVTVIVDPADYAVLMETMTSEGGGTTAELRRRLAAKAFSHTAAYDAAIAAWFAREGGEAWPERLVVTGTRQHLLRYGENPHQAAAFYVTDATRLGLAAARQLQGKELSYNNLNDTDAAFELVAEFSSPAVAIIKHANPCGVATAETLAEAWSRAWACDPVSAFGGVVAVNRILDGPTAAALAAIFLEVVIAPAADDDARRLLASKKNLRLLVTGAMPDPAAPGVEIRSVAGGLLAQTRDDAVTGPALKVVTKRAPTNAEMADLEFAWRVCKHVKSNAIVYARNGATVGIGAGQMSRVDSARIGAWKAEDARTAAGEDEARTQGAAVASDAFFPFPDGLLVCADAGATSVIQPGGSVRDEEVIAAADERGMAMVFTGMRHFRH